MAYYVPRLKKWWGHVSCVPHQIVPMDTYTGPTHYISWSPSYTSVIVEKRRFVKSIRHLKRYDEKVRSRCTTLQEVIKIISQ